MPLSVGDRLGPYEILAPIGAGGMGEVWKARDTRLDRIVAIKTSQAKFSERFEREARAVAALNHPHICALYDVGPDYLVMEYVEGKPLSGPLPIAQALEYAAQICDALGDAHRKGIVHRDLKPGNILVGKNGVKILDFGLAKIDPKQVPGQATATIPLTEEGTVLGTLQYMSPEQLEGQEADARSDIFALGLVLYEMISGKRPFTGKTRTSLVASILKDQPQPLRALDPLTPAAVDRVIATCLEKDPDKRWQSARDVGSALDLVSQVAPLPSAPARAPSRSRLALAGWMVAAIVLLAAGLGAWRLWPKPAPPASVVRFEVPLPDKVTSSQYVTVSPDGQKLVLDAANSGLWIRNLASLEWRLLPETQGAGLPFWSPDSRFLGFAAGSELKKIDVTGGPPQTLCELPGQVARTGAWGTDGTIVFNGSNGSIWRVSAAGGIPTAVTSLDTAHGETVHADPSFLPDGKHFLYLRYGGGGGLGAYLGSLDAKPAEQSKQRFLASQRAAYYADGYVFFMRENTLMAQPFDTAKFQLKGDPVPVAEHVATSTTVGFFSVSASGVLAYREGAQNVNSQLTWFDRQGKAVETSGQPAPFFGIQLSPDGKRAAGRDALQQATGDI